MQLFNTYDLEKYSHHLEYLIVSTIYLLRVLIGNENCEICKYTKRSSKYLIENKTKSKLQKKLTQLRIICIEKDTIFIVSYKNI